MRGRKCFFFFFFCSLKLFKLYAELSGTVWSERKCTLTMLSDGITSIRAHTHTHISHTCWWFRGHGIVSAGFNSCSCSTKVKLKQRLISSALTSSQLSGLWRCKYRRSASSSSHELKWLHRMCALKLKAEWEPFNSDVSADLVKIPPMIFHFIALSFLMNCIERVRKQTF